MLFLWVGYSYGQAGLYSSSTATNATLVDMSTGTTPLLTVATYHDDDASVVTNIGFNFVYCGTTYTQFSANSNGQLRLGATAISGGAASPALNVPLLLPLSGDNAILATGKLHYKLTGSSPNQVLVVEWSGFRIPYGSTGTASTMQALLSENGGQIQFIYGAMYNNSTSASTRGVCISSSNVAGANGNWTTITATPTYTTTATGITTTSFTASSDMTNLNGTVAGSLRTFTFTPPVAGTPLPPTTPSPANAAIGVPTSGSLTWTFGTNTATYDLMFGPTGSMTQVVTGASAGATGSYTYSGLSNSTNYSWQVIEHNGALTTNGPTWNFFTVCASYSSLNENFDLVTSPALPGCWSKYISPSYTSETVQTYTTYFNSSPNCVSLYSSGATLATDAPLLITPQISNLNAGTYQLKFFARGASTNTSVIVGTMSDPAVSSTFTPFQTITGLSTTAFTEYIISFASYAGTDQYIAFRHPLTTTYSYIYIDNVVWEPIPACPPPTALTASGMTNNSANLGWTNPGATLWNVEYGLNGYTHLGAGATVVAANANPFTLSGLAANTAYQYYVQANCGGAGLSTWAGPYAFTTLCDPVNTIPYNEGFETGYTHATVFGNCWTQQIVTGSYNWTANNTLTDYNRAPRTGAWDAYLHYSADTWMFRGFTLTAGTSYDVSVWARQDGSTTTNASMEIKYGTTATAAGMTNVIAAPLGLNTTYQQVIGTFTPAATGVYFIGFHGVINGSPWYITIDDIKVDLTPSCPPPTALMATNIDGHNATFGWTQSGTATSWDIEYGPTPFTPTGTPTMTGVTNPVTISGLTPVTGYAYYVRANCGGTYSTWSGPKTFTTTVACPIPTALTATSISTSKENLSWTDPTGSAWEIEYGVSPYTFTGIPNFSIPSNPYQLGGLTAATTYQYKIRRDCNSVGDGFSDWSATGTFTTLCAVAVPTVSETFEGTTFPTVCWSRYTGVLAAPSTLTASTSPWIQDDWRNITSPVDKAARMNIWSTNYGWLMTPQIDLGSGSIPYQLEFDLTLNAYGTSTAPAMTGTDDKFAVVVSTDGGTTWTSANTLRLWDNAGSAYVYNNINPAGERIIIPLTGYTGIVMIGFYGESSVSNADNDLMVNNFVLQEVPSCPAPYSLTHANVTGHTADLGWTAGGAETSWEVEYGLNGFTLGTGILISSTTNPQNITGLAGGTAYSFYVRANCGGGLLSPWAGPHNFTTSITCAAPTALTATPGTNPQTEENLGWTDATGTSWIVEYGINGYTHEGTGAIVVNPATNPHLLTGLTPSTTYKYYVRTDCGTEGLSAWAGPYTFTTACPSVTSYPWTEGFESVTIPALPACWFKENGDYITTNNANSTYDADAHTGGQFLREAYSATNEYIWTPLFELQAGTSYDFSFYWAGDNYAGWTGDVFYNTSQSSTGATQLGTSFVVGATTTTKTYAQVKHSFIPPATGSYSFAIRVNCPTTAPWYLSFDDFTMELSPLCGAPTALTATAITNTSALLGWTVATGGTKWNIDYGPAGFSHIGGTQVNGLLTNSYQIPVGTLTASTAYEFYVQTDCAPNGTSTWSGPYPFTTAMCAVSCNYTFNLLDSYGDGWNSGTIQVKQNGTVMGTLSLSGSSGTQTIALCDGLPIELLWNTAGSYPEEMGLTMVDPFSVVLFTLPYNSEALAGTVIYTGTGNCTPPACAVPTAQTTTVITNAGANLGWTSTASFFDIYIVPTGTIAPDPLTTPTVNDWNTGTSYTWTGGSAATTYDWYVRADCAAGGGTGQSAWSMAQTFTTLCNPYTIPYTENFDGVTAPALPVCISLTNDNADTRLWQTYNGYANSAPNCMLIAYNSSAAMNDWFFSPGLSLAAGTYRVSFWYKNDGGTLYTEKLEVKWGSAPSAAGMTNGPIFDDANIGTAVYLNGTGDMVVTTPGTYYVGWHGYSDADMDILTVDDISITEVLSLDAKTVSIDNIGGVVSSGTTITPQATVMNNGLTNPAVFDVTMTASDGYTSTVYNVSVGAGLTAPVTFAGWTPADGVWTVNVCTQLAGDQNITNNCQSTSVKIFTVPATQVYAYNAYTNSGTDPEGPTSFLLSTPGTLNSIADQSALNFVAGGSWANGIWYGVVATDNTLISIDPVTGARTTIGALGFGMNGLSYNKANSIMYANSGTSLYTVDLTTGAATLVGSNTGISMLNLAINSAGVAYTVDAIADNLGTIDLATGVYTVVGPIGFNANYAQDMEFDRVTGDLYMAAQDMTSGWLAWVDITSGKAYKIGDFEGGAEITGLAIPYPEYKTLNGKVFLEGLYNTGTGAMNQAMDIAGPKFTAPVADKIDVLLYSTSNLVTPAETRIGVDLNQNGTFSITDLPGAMAGQYYIVIKHRNSIETWSGDYPDFSGAGPIIWDFTTAQNMAYGSNLKSMGTIWAIWSGDVSQDGIVDGTDMLLIDNASKPPALQGYYPEDVNGDGIVDGSDMLIIDNNSKPPAVQVVRP